MKLVEHMHFKIIRESNIYKIMASLDDQKIIFEPFLREITPINSISYDPENGSKCCLKTLKNGTKRWLDTLIKLFLATRYGRETKA